MASGRIKGLTIEIGGDTTKLNKALSQVDNALRNTSNKLKDVDKLLKFDPGNTELLRQKQKALADALTQTKDRLTQLKDAQSQVAKGSEEWDTLQREIIETEQSLKKFEDELSSFGGVAAQKVQLIGQKFQEVGGKIEQAGQAMSRISGIAVGALGGIAKLGYDAVTAADDLNTLSKQTGVSTDQLQKWSYASDLVDVSVESMTGSMKKMKKQLDSNEDGFKQLGVRTRDNYGNMRDAVDIFYDTLTALSKIENETERDIAAMDIFGKSADDLAGIIDDGGKALRDYGREAQQMGLIIGGDTLNKLNEANDTIDKMKATMGASFAQAGATIAQTFTPAMEKAVKSIEKVAEKIRTLTPEQAELIVKILAVVAALSPVLIIIGKVVSAIGTIIVYGGKLIGGITAFMTKIGGLQGLLTALTGPVGIVVAAIAALVAAFVYFYKTNEQFREKVNAVFDSVKEKIAVFIEQVKVWFQQFVESCRPIFDGIQELGTALNEFFQALIPVLIAIFEQIQATVTGFLTKHQAEIQFVLTFLKEEVLAAFDIIKTYIQTVLDVIINIVRAFTSLLKGDWSGALNFLKTAAESAKNGVVSIFKRLGEMLHNIFGDLIAKMKQWGSDMISNLVQGIKDKFNAVKDTIAEVAETIRSYLHFSEPDVGPLSDFSTYAPDMMRLFAQGIRDNAYLITDAIGSSFDLRPYLTTMNSGIDRLNRTANTTAEAQAQSPVVVNVSLQGDAQRLFRVLSEEAHKDWQITGQSRLMGY